MPRAGYIAVRGQGDPNEEGGAYKAAVGVLYAVAYTVKMSKLGDRRIDGFDDTRKDLFRWISVIRLPDFVTRADFSWACEAAAKKKKLDCSAAEFLISLHWMDQLQTRLPSS